jgi:hypothetical protein
MQFYTLNQLINLFETIATNHAQINGFNFGEASDISASEQEQYPLLWIDVIDSAIDSNTLSLNINVKVMDIQKDDQTNERDTLSDCLSISQDVYSALTNPIYQDYFLLSFATNLVPLREALADKVNGWEMNLTFELAQERNRCQIPLK